jgi:hypothetical protein
MSLKKKEVPVSQMAEDTVGLAPDEQLDPQLQGALQDFRLSVHAWSDAVLSRPRAIPVSRSRVWRLAAAWSFSAVLVAAGVSGGGFYQYHHQQLQLEQAHQAELQRLAAEQRAKQEEEDLLAKVDSDVSRVVPTAMEPLARLMDEDETR